MLVFRVTGATVLLSIYADTQRPPLLILLLFMKPESYSDDDCFRLLKQGDSGVLQYLIRIYSPVLNRYLVQITSINSAEAEDVVLEVFIKLWERRSRFTSFGEVKGFLYVAARNGGLNLLRGKQREKKRAATFTQLYGNETAIGSEAETETVYAELLAEIRKSIYSLPPRMREIFILSYYKKRSDKWIAAHLDLSHQTVRNHKTRALALLRKWLGKKDPVLLFILSAWVYQPQ